MKKYIKLISIFSIASLLLLATTPSSIALADNTSQDVKVDNVKKSNTKETLTADEVSKFDPYIKVQNNRYVLQLPANNASFSSQEIETVQANLKEVNKFVEENNLVINPQTKEATDNNLSRKEGKTTVKVHWNYARVYLKKSTANGIKNGAIGAAGVLAGKIPNGYVEAGAAAILAILSGMSIKGGLWLDYNYFAKTIVNWGWQ